MAFLSGLFGKAPDTSTIEGAHEVLPAAIKSLVADAYRPFITETAKSLTPEFRTIMERASTVRQAKLLSDAERAEFEQKLTAYAGMLKTRFDVFKSRLMEVSRTLPLARDDKVNEAITRVVVNSDMLVRKVMGAIKPARMALESISRELKSGTEEHRALIAQSELEARLRKLKEGGKRKTRKRKANRKRRATRIK